jgi:hypothetical protein
MLDCLEEIRAFRQFWFVTITPYGKEIEPNVPEKQKVMDSFRRLSGQVGVNAIGWRYDPIFLTEKYDLDFHIRSFERMADPEKFPGRKGCDERRTGADRTGICYYRRPIWDPYPFLL